VLVSVQSSVDDTTEEIIEDDSQGLGSHHAVQGSNEDSFLGIQPLGLTASIIGVGQHPGNDLNFLILCSHPPARDLVIIGVSGSEILIALGQEILNVSFFFKD